MRMWMVKPEYLCTKHLMGEHGEIHKHIPSFRKHHSIDGRFSPVVQIQIDCLQERHDDLAEEINRRAKKGGGHKSPLVDVPDMKSIYPQHYDKKVDALQSLLDLSERCPDCKKRIEKFFL